MRPTVWAALLAILFTSWAGAQEVRQASDWKKMYDDVSAQLRAAQDRKSEMSKQIADLTARLAMLQTRLQAAQDQLDSLHRAAEDEINRTYFLNSIYNGWEVFTLANPDVRDRWRSFWAFGLAGFHDDFPVVGDPQWPLTMP